MRRVALALLVSVVPVFASRAAHADDCPLARARTKAPQVVAVKDLAAARAVLLKNAANMDGEPDVLEPAPSHDAFSVDVRRAWEEGGDSSYWETSVVFVLGTRVVIAQGLAHFANVLPPRCGYPRAETVVDARIVKEKSRTLGVVRVKRRGARDTARLPAQASTRADDCQDMTTYRIEDHVIDLASRREILVVSGAYEGPEFEELAPPIALPTVDARGLSYEDARCTTFAYRR